MNYEQDYGANALDDVAETPAPVVTGPGGHPFTHRVGQCTTLREYVNEASFGPCWKCGGGDETHTPEGPRDRGLRPERGGVDAVVALAFGMPVRWAVPESERRSPQGHEQEVPDA